MSALPALMRAAVFDGKGQPLRLASLPVPRPGAGELLLRLEASGVCHSDVHIWQGHVVPAVAPDPFILGHEGVGTVAAIGEGVEGWKIGERAGAAWLHQTCGTCSECLGGNESFCQRQRAHGLDVPGTFAEYVVTRAAFTPRLPAGEAAPIAPLMCAGVTAFGALDRAHLARGETCAIFGCGGLGLYAVQMAHRRGARVIAVDTDPAKLAIAARLGADEAILPQAMANDPAAHAAAAHVAINFAPTTATWANMVAITRPLGRIVAAAMVSAPVALNQEWLTATGITITGTSVGSRLQMQAMLDEHARAPFHGEVATIPLEGVSAALSTLAEGKAAGRFTIVF